MKKMMILVVMMVMMMTVGCGTAKKEEDVDAVCYMTVALEDGSTVEAVSFNVYDDVVGIGAIYDENGEYVSSTYQINGKDATLEEVEVVLDNLDL